MQAPTSTRRDRVAPAEAQGGLAPSNDARTPSPVRRPRAVAMKLTGHETDAVYSRYHIARGKDLRAGVARVADYIEALHDSVQESGKETATAIRVPKVSSRKFSINGGGPGIRTPIPDTRWWISSSNRLSPHHVVNSRHRYLSCLCEARAPGPKYGADRSRTMVTAKK
jgi:hypothetical protein